MSIEEVFEGLKRDEHIHKKRKLKAGRNFRGEIFLGRILYPEAALKREPLSDDTLRFVLLHEEGHLGRFKAPKYTIWILAAYMLFWIIHFFTGLNLIPVTILYIFNPLTIFTIIILLFITVFKRYELKCDRWAAEIVKKEYDIAEPTVLLDDLYSWLEKISGNKDIKHLKKRIATAPSFEELIENLKDV